MRNTLIFDASNSRGKRRYLSGLWLQCLSIVIG
jgi:hypothetical protein